MVYIYKLYLSLNEDRYIAAVLYELLAIAYLLTPNPVGSASAITATGLDYNEGRLLIIALLTFSAIISVNSEYSLLWGIVAFVPAGIYALTTFYAGITFNSYIVMFSGLAALTLFWRLSLFYPMTRYASERLTDVKTYERETLQDKIEEAASEY